MTTKAHQRAASGVDSLQALYGLALFGLLISLPVAAALGVTPGPAPAWLLWAITTVVGVIATFAVFYWRIRPVAPGDIDAYRSVVRLRLALSALPAATAFVLFALAGHWSVMAVGVLWVMPGFAASAPTDTDYQRHQDLWDARLPMPASHTWGTADPDAIAPWEDPDGGHGHGIGHGLH